MKTSHAFLLIGAALAWAGSARAHTDVRDDARAACQRAAIETCGSAAAEGGGVDAARMRAEKE